MDKQHEINLIAIEKLLNANKWHRSRDKGVNILQRYPIPHYTIHMMCKYLLVD